MKKHNKVRLLAFLAIILVVVATRLIRSFSPPVWLSVLSALIYIAVYCIAAIALWRVAKMDELQKLIELRAIAIAFVFTLAILLIIGSFEAHGLIQLEITADLMLIMMVFAGFAGQVIANWKYHPTARDMNSTVNEH